MAPTDREGGTMAHPNEEVLRTAYNAFSKGDMETLRGLFTDDAAGHIIGRSQISGDYQGPDAVFGFFGKLFELSGGPFAVDVHLVIADDNYVQVLDHYNTH